MHFMCLELDTGEVVGALSLPVGNGSAMLKKVASARMLHQPANMQNIVSYPLRRRVRYVH